MSRRICALCHQSNLFLALRMFDLQSYIAPSSTGTCLTALTYDCRLAGRTQTCFRRKRLDNYRLTTSGCWCSRSLAPYRVSRDRTTFGHHPNSQPYEHTGEFRRTSPACHLPSGAIADRLLARPAHLVGPTFARRRTSASTPCSTYSYQCELRRLGLHFQQRLYGHRLQHFCIHL